MQGQHQLYNKQELQKKIFRASNLQLDFTYSGLSFSTDQQLDTWTGLANQASTN